MIHIGTNAGRNQDTISRYLPLLADDRHSILQLNIIEKALQKHICHTD